MRMSEADHSGPIFPGDERDVLGIDYFLDEERFDARGTSFPMKVAATFYIGPRRVAHAEKTVEKLQNF